MAIAEMSFISMIGSFDKLDDLVHICGKSGVFQPDNVFSFYSNTENFSTITDENPYAQSLQTLTNAVYSGGGKLERVDVSDFHVSKSKIDKYVRYVSKSIEDLVDEKRDLYQQLTSAQEDIAILKKFYGLDKSLKDILECQYAVAHFGKMPKAAYEKLPTLANNSLDKGIELMFFPTTNDANYQWGLYFANEEQGDEINRLFSSMYFEEIELEPYDKSPYEVVTELQNGQKEIYRKIENVDKQLANFWNSQKSQCIRFYSKLKILSTYFDVKSYAAKYNESFILVGWVPKEDLQRFISKIKQVDGVEYSTEEGKNILKHAPPVKLKNHKFFKPFEFFVDTYGMPSYGELDPTAFVAITYSILFGIMFADFGQGLVVSLVGLLMWKLKKMKLGKILIPCGLFSALFGLVFGSVFGFEHALDPFYERVFGLEEKPIEVMNSSTTILILYASIGLGVFLLITAMCLGIYSAIKRKCLGEAIFGSSGLCGVVFYCSAIFMLLDMMIFHTGVVNALYIVLFIVAPLILLMFSELFIKLFNKEPDWKPESWIVFLMQSVIELFEVVLSYVTNTVSFSRVGAYVLSHTGLMMAVFTLAEMLSGGGRVAVIVIGNIIVIALEALLSGIQVLRLDFFEMFSRFFEGQGQAYMPVRAEEET